MPVLDPLHLDSLLSLQSCSQVGLLLPLCGVSGMGLFLSPLDAAHLDLSIFLRSPVWMGSALPILDLMHLGSSPLLRSFARRPKTDGVDIWLIASWGKGGSISLLRDFLDDLFPKTNGSLYGTSIKKKNTGLYTYFSIFKD